MNPGQIHVRSDGLAERSQERLAGIALDGGEVASVQPLAHEREKPPCIVGLRSSIAVDADNVVADLSRHNAFVLGAVEHDPVERLQHLDVEVEVAASLGQLCPQSLESGNDVVDLSAQI